MGKSIKVRFSLSYNYISFSEKCNKIGKVYWDTKTNGLPTVANIQKWRTGFNESLISGANKHLNAVHSLVSKCWVTDHKNGGTVAEYNPPAFEII